MQNRGASVSSPGSQTPDRRSFLASAKSGGITEPALLKSIEGLDPPAEGILQVHAPCLMRGALQGDHYLFAVNGPYGPQNEEQPRALKRVDGMGRLEAVAVAVR